MVCVCERERERDRDQIRGKDRVWGEGVWEGVCVRKRERMRSYEKELEKL